MKNILHQPNVVESRNRHTRSDGDVSYETEFEEKEYQRINAITIGVFGFLIFLGIGTGFVLAKRINTSDTNTFHKASSIGQDVKKSFGVSDTKAFPDSATGILESGGLNGEGTHKLIRDGGPSQTVYVISSIVDLDQFIGKKVTVWGQTIAAKQAPWLMDVGRVDLKE
ncbi:MAG: hypothetical protein N3A54_04620 [Patescibacteria group bacterium]|nr:hypothetical protein [Patescibacteria group bacterium]